jgi:hypothetical protein
MKDRAAPIGEKQAGGKAAERRVGIAAFRRFNLDITVNFKGNWHARFSSNPVEKGNTTMFHERVVRKAINLGVVGLFGLGLLAVDSAPSFAGNCGGHCQVMKRCGELVKEKGLKGGAYQSEFNKCMTDAANYK